MTVADAIHDYRERCQPHLIRLRMLSTEQWPGPSAGVAAEVGRATGAVLAQAQAASRVALAGSRDSRSDQGPGAFLGARLARLRTAAEDAVAAARSGNAAALRQRLVRFDALTSAIWAAQDAAHDWAVPPQRAQGRVALANACLPSRGGFRCRRCACLSARFRASFRGCRLARDFRAPVRLTGHAAGRWARQHALTSPARVAVRVVHRRQPSEQREQRDNRDGYRQPTGSCHYGPPIRFPSFQANRPARTGGGPSRSGRSSLVRPVLPRCHGNVARRS